MFNISDVCNLSFYSKNLFVKTVLTLFSHIDRLHQRIGIKIEANANLYVVGIATY